MTRTTTTQPIKKATNGSYYFRITLGTDPLTGKQIQKYRSGFKTRKEAQTAYAILLLEKPMDSMAEKEKCPTFKAFTEEIFLPWYKTQVKEQTYNNRLGSIRRHFAYFYKKQIDQIQPIHVQSWQLALCKKMKKSYVRGLQGLLTMALNRAVTLNLIANNPAKAVGNVKKEKAKIDFWTKEEFETVVSTINVNDFYQFFLFTCLWLLFMTGLRVGEATALQWGDLDFDTGVLDVHKTLYYRNQQQYKFVDPKTPAGRRSIVLDEDTLHFLHKWNAMQSRILNTSFILSYNNLPTQKYTIAKAIDRYAKHTGVHRITTHALRHSHASLLISMGENPLIIKERLGHEDIETTLGTYGHLYPNSNFEVAHKLKGIVNIKFSSNNQAVLNKNQHTRDVPH